MIIGHLVHARMVYPGNINEVVNPSDQPHDFSFHVFKKDPTQPSGEREIAIRYSLEDANTASELLGGYRFEKKRIFKQFPAKETVAKASKLAA